MNGRTTRAFPLLCATVLLTLADAGYAGEPEKAEKAAATPPADESTPVPDKEALADDILDAIALPLVADEARDAGIDSKEVESAIDAVDEGGATAADAGAVLEAEATQARKRGGKPGFGAWVRLQVAEGKRGKELADLIAKKKATYAELTDEQKAEVEAKLAKLRERAIEHRKRVHERRKELVAAGKKLARANAKRLADLEKRLAKNEKRKARVDAALAADPAKKEKLEKVLEAMKRRGERLEDRGERAEERGERLEDAKERVEDRKEDREDRKEDRKEDREDRKEDREDRKEDREDRKEKRAKKQEGKGG